MARGSNDTMLFNHFPMKFTSLMVFFMALLSFSCRHNKHDVDLGSISIPFSIDRFEMDLFNADPSAIEDSLPSWKARYGNFLQYFSYVEKLGNVDDPAFPARLRLFATDHTNYMIYRRTMQVYPGLDPFQSDLKEAFGHYRYYFPERKIPRIITYVGGFTQSAITGDSLLAIGLDKYLGTNEPLYRDAGFYHYLVVNMYPKKLTSDAMLFWAETEFPFYDSVNNLVANMIYKGRMLYFADAMMPGQPDTVRWGFSKSNLEFCRQNEKAMWAQLIEKKFLFTTDRFSIDKFILEGPYTKDFGRNSPGRAAIWIGYRIVEAYMKKSPDVNLKELMSEKDYMKVLNQSAYNP
jgi:hypothetical protein